jgi:UPF0042 nucleotide-binding protein
MTPTSEPVVLLTGLSGAGKTVAAKAIEDAGYEVVDALPAGVLARVADELVARPRIAVVVDVRCDRPVEAAAALRAAAAAAGRELRAISVEAPDEVLLRRFAETRHRHPIDPEGGRTAAAVVRERDQMAAVTAGAVRIDTAAMAPRDLGAAVVAAAGGAAVEAPLVLLSFGYKHGLPAEADFVFDARSLPNPHWEPALRPRDGRDPAVAAHALGHPAGEAYLGHLVAYLRTAIAAAAAEGRPALTVAVGCTGGRHRSVAVVEALAAVVGPETPLRAWHRDLGRP